MHLDRQGAFPRPPNQRIGEAMADHQVPVRTCPLGCVCLTVQRGAIRPYEEGKGRLSGDLT